MNRFILAATIAVSGCAVDPVFDKISPTASPFEQAQGECDAYAVANTPPQFGRSQVIQRVYASCMQGKGWRRTN